MRSQEDQVLEALFPKEFLAHFATTGLHYLCDIVTQTDIIHIHFDEKNELSQEYNSEEYESKGFDNGKTIQDFPLRGKPVFLVVRSRIWRHKKTGKPVKNDYSIIADGSRMTSELSDFLKSGGKYQSRHGEQYS